MIYSSSRGLFSLFNKQVINTRVHLALTCSKNIKTSSILKMADSGTGDQKLSKKYVFLLFIFSYIVYSYT